MKKEILFKTLKKLPVFLGLGAIVCGFNITQAQNSAYLKGDFHQHSTYTDGSYSIDTVMKSNKYYGLDWWANSEHGGGFNRNGKFSGLNLGNTVYWDSYIPNPVTGTVSMSGGHQNMWRWQSIRDYSFQDVLNTRIIFPGITVFQALEWNVPGHEHCSMGIINNQYDANPNANPVAEFEFKFDAGDADQIGGVAQGWVKSTNANNHTKALEAISWVQTNYPNTSWMIPAHPERKSLYNIAAFRDMNNAGPSVCFGFESMGGHQKASDRGEYKKNYNTDGITTYGGCGIYAAKVGGLWDALISEGRAWWLFASSDFHNDQGADFWPGEYQKTFTYVTDRNNPQSYVDGLRSGNSFVVNGDLIDSLIFEIKPVNSNGVYATMGQTLPVCGKTKVLHIKVRDPQVANHNIYSSYNNPELNHIDIIEGRIIGKVQPSDPDYNVPSVSTTNVIARFDANGGITDNNGLTSKSWIDLGDGWKEMTLVLNNYSDTMYYRLRGTNLGLNIANETDANGNPLSDSLMYPNTASKAFADLWFYTNPVFVASNVNDSINTASYVQNQSVQGNSSICVASDLHLMDPSLLINDGVAFQTYLSYDRKLIKESNAITQELANQIYNESPEIFLVPGDLTKDGEKVSHLKLAQYLANIESNGVTKVFVIPGNHDVNNVHAYSYNGNLQTKVDSVSPSDFKSIYNQFGYAEAYNIDTLSLSYLAKPKQKLWVLGIDALSYDENILAGQPITEGKFKLSTYKWVLDRLKEAKDSNAVVLGMMHHGVTEHYTGQSVVFPEYVVNGWDTISVNFAKAGLKMMFTGHYHANDITKRTAPGNADFIYDIETGSTVTWPCPYRVMQLEGNSILNVSTKYITNINFNTNGMPFQDYAHNFLTQGLSGIVSYQLQNPPYSLDAATTTVVAPHIVSAFEAHYAGDETIPASEQGFLNYLNSVGQIVLSSTIASLRTDLAPMDNNVAIPLLYSNQEPLSNLQYITSIQINQASDDQEEFLVPNSLTGETLTGAVAGQIDFNSSDLELGQENGLTNNNPQMIGLRFRNINIDKTTALTNAWLRFEVDATNKNANPCNLVIYAEDADSANTFNATTTYTPFELTSRPKLTDSIIWNVHVDSLKTVDQRNNSVDISPLIQKIVNRPGWKKGNAIAFYITGKGTREVESFEGEAAAAAILNLKYYLTKADSLKHASMDSIIAIANSKVDSNYSIPSYTELKRAIVTASANKDSISMVNLITAMNNLQSKYTPYSITVNLNKDPKSKMAFNWFTNAGIYGGKVQIVQGNSTDFSSPLMTINAKVDSVKNLNYCVSANGLASKAGIANNTKKSYISNKALATGLTPNTTYSFRVGNDSAWSETGSFKTAVAGKENFSFIYFTDPQANTDEMFNISQKTTHSANNMYPNADFWLSCGDLVETSGSSNSEWEYEQFFKTQQDIFLNKPFVPVHGNHDKSINRNFTHHFNMDSVAFDYAKSTTPGSVYSYVYGDALFMAFSYEDYSVAGYLDSLAYWMNKQVKANPDIKWRIAYYHKTMYTGSGSHQSDADGKTVRQKMGPVFDSLKIDIALQGHDHIYEIIGPVKNITLIPNAVSNQQTVPATIRDNITGLSGGTFDTKQGTLYFLNNSGGKKKYEPRTQAQMTAVEAGLGVTNYFGMFTGRFGQTGEPTFSNIDVTTDTISVSTYTVDDQGVATLFDSFKVIKNTLENQWTGINGNNWNNAKNWSENVLPTNTQDVVIPSTAANMPMVDAEAICKNITLESGAQLIQNTNIVLKGTAKVKQELNANQWHFISSPVNNATAYTFSTQNPINQNDTLYLQKYNEAWINNAGTSPWVDITTGSLELMNPGKGYEVWSDKNHTVTFEGSLLNRNSVNANVMFTPSASYPGYNLIGNPFPSGISISDFSNWGNNMDASIWIWNGANYLSSNGVLGDFTAIAPKQAFMVKANGAGMPSLTIPSTAKTFGGSFYKSSVLINDVLKLKVSGNNYSDVAYINFNSNASNAYDGQFDVVKMFGINEAPQFYSVIANKNLSINTLPALNGIVVVQMALNVGKSGTYSINASEINSFDNNITILLEDVITNTFTNLRQQSFYNFTANPTDISNRFKVHFGGFNSINEIGNESEISIYSDNNIVYINNIGNETIKEISVLNLLGQPVISKKALNNLINTIELNVSAAYYIVRVVTESNVYTQKVYIK